MNHRQKAALQMRSKGRSFREIGEALGGVSPHRALAIVRSAERLQQQHWCAGLPSRIVGTLARRGIASREELHAALTDGSLSTRCGIGAHSLQTLRQWLQVVD